MSKPSFREFDPVSKRGDDIKIGALGMTLEASGRTVTLVICALAVVVWGFWHDQNTDAQVAGIMREQARVAAELASEQQQTSASIATLTCVLTLSEQERVVFRRDGRYCGGYNAARVREQVTEEPKPTRDRELQR